MENNTTFKETNNPDYAKILLNNRFITHEQSDAIQKCGGRIDKLPPNVLLSIISNRPVPNGPYTDHIDLLKSTIELVNAATLFLLNNGTNYLENPNDINKFTLDINNVYQYAHRINLILNDERSVASAYIRNNITLNIDNTFVNINDILVQDGDFDDMDIFTYLLWHVEEKSISHDVVRKIIRGHTHYGQDISISAATNIINKFQEYKKLDSLRYVNKSYAEIYVNMYTLSVLSLLLAPYKIGERNANWQYNIGAFASGCMKRIMQISTDLKTKFKLNDVDISFLEVFNENMELYWRYDDVLYSLNNVKQIGRDDKNDLFCNTLKSSFANWIEQITNPSLNKSINNSVEMSEFISRLKPIVEKQQQESQEGQEGQQGQQNFATTAFVTNDQQQKIQQQDQKQQKIQQQKIQQQDQQQQEDFMTKNK